MPELVANHIKMHFLVAGQGQPVILIHGFSSTHTLWFLQVPALAPSYRVIAYDVRGHGDSEHPDSGHDMDTLVADLAALMDSLEIPSAHIAGLSMGGMIAQRFCLDHPDRTATLTVADSFPGRPAASILDTFGHHQELVREGGLLKLFNFLLDHPALPIGPDFEIDPKLMDAYKDNFMKNDPMSLEAFVAMFNCLPDWSHELSGIKSPTLLIVGDHDTPCLEPMRAMHEAIPGSEFCLIPRCGHASALEKPKDFNNLLLAFLGKHTI